MGDEDTVMIRRRQLLRRPKIIIRKCKKTTPASKNLEECNKINGELSSEKEGKEDSQSSGVNIVSKNETPRKTTITKRSIRKRHLSGSTTDSIYLDDNNETPKIVEEQKLAQNDVHEDSSCIEYKGFKKRILAQSEKISDIAQDKSNSLEDLSISTKAAKSKNKVDPGGRNSNEGDSDENQGDSSQTEYAQYLGLQPTMQFKCYRCGERGFPSMLALNLHQRGCGVDQRTNFIANLQQDTSITSSDPNMLTNFRITRKVYLCSACGTYYENWNLFLHMRDVHKKHICLFCLTMFGVADKLADHLKNIHSVQEITFSSSEEFQSTYNGTYYLICCSCENMFSEGENYFNHRCEKRDPAAKCNLCGVKCGHYFTCPNSNSQRNVPASVNATQANKNQEIGTAKYLTSKGKSSEALWMDQNKKGQSVTQSDYEDLYDISNAASFCHVALADDIGESEKNVYEDNIIDITEDSNESGAIDATPTEVIATATKEEMNSNSADPKDDPNLKNADNKICATENIQELTNNTDKSVPEKNVDKPSDEPVLDKQEKENKQIVHERPCDEIEIDNQNELGSIKIDNPTKDDVCDSIADINKPTNMSNHPAVNIGKSESEPTEETLIENGDKENNRIELVDPKSDIPEAIDVEPNDKTQDKSNGSESDSSSCDSDIEPDTQHSISHGDSDSSSSPSCEDEHSNKDDNLTETTKMVIPSESSGNDTPTQLLEEYSKNNESTDKKMCNSEENSNVLDTKSNGSSDISKDLNLDECPIIEKYGFTDSIDQPEDSSKDLPDSPSLVVNDGIPLASEDVPAMALTLDGKLEEASAQSVVKECVRTSCQNCVYCSHAIKIAVNGKQLALHLLAEHRYKPVKINETSQDVVSKLKASLSELELLFFNTDSYDSSDKTLNKAHDFTYECFQCHFVTSAHKDLCIHKKKMHLKTVSLCVMCKSNFYSYSELLCHMCPGIYVSEDITFRCCFCNLDRIPSAFRLMVHLRKSHHTCDICLEIAGDQQKLSTHMWKHKLNHLCYRCGIAYRNKPDITKHLFWKHGTESVLCKKCLQKKWPHVYHFCIPPTVFICEECNASFTKAVALKVHKRVHSGEFPHECQQCDQRFVSRKLLLKHEDSHNQPTTEIGKDESCHLQNGSTDEHINVESIDEPDIDNSIKDVNTLITKEKDNPSTLSYSKSKKKKKKEKESKPVLDVYDLPPLNLSSESDSSDEEAVNSKLPANATENNDSIPLAEIKEFLESNVPETVDPPEENPVPVVDGVWDNFHSYKAELEKRESKDLSLPNILPSTSLASTDIKSPDIESPSLFLMDHDYCLAPGQTNAIEKESNEKTTSDHIKDSENLPVSHPNEVHPKEALQEANSPRGHSSSVDHDYCNAESALLTDQKPSTPAIMPMPQQIISQVTPPVETCSPTKKKHRTPKKKKQNINSSSSSDSSSDSDTTACEGDGCTCHTSSSSISSSSSSDSDSSTSEEKSRIVGRKEKKKEKLKHKHHKEDPPVDTLPLKETPAVDILLDRLELPIKESDLDTDESSTDEDFYDKYPQSQQKDKLMMLANLANVNNGSVSPPPDPPPRENENSPALPPTAKRKIKTKRRRISKQSKKANSILNIEPSTSLKSPAATSTPHHLLSSNYSLLPNTASPHRTYHPDPTGSGSENESARLPKRKRVRNKFYGYSSGEEDGKPSLKIRKVVHLQAPLNTSYQPGFSAQKPQIGQTIGTVPSDSSESDNDAASKNDNDSITRSSSSDSDNEMDSGEQHNVKKQPNEKSAELYCYCQCPYDEVSEMIACDGEDCAIEWFHFECVGVMAPPKGKWYCPDCRKRRDLM